MCAAPLLRYEPRSAVDCIHIFDLSTTSQPLPSQPRAVKLFHRVTAGAAQRFDHVGKGLLQSIDGFQFSKLDAGGVSSDKN
jgi:hypothetical protein